MLKPITAVLVATAIAALSTLAPTVASAAPSAAASGSSDVAESSAATLDASNASTANQPEDTRSLCNNGDHQSPIDIAIAYPYRWDYHNKQSYPTKVTAPRLRFVMFPSSLEVSREIDGVSTRITSGSYTRVNRDRYELKEIRFRTPAEHLINGYRYPAEIQFLHRHDNALAIFSVFVQEGGTANPTLREILNNAPHQVGETNSFRRRRIDTALLLPGSKGFFVYDGSLSTQPCTEQVTRFVMKNPIRATREQILALRGLSGDTARSVQPLGERTVLQTAY